MNNATVEEQDLVFANVL